LSSQTFDISSSEIYQQKIAEYTLISNGKFNPNQVKYYAWILKNAQLFRDVDKERSKEFAKNLGLKIRQCYKNAWMISSYGIRYFEGFVWSERVPIPIEHGWGVLDGKVIDPTLAIKVKGNDDRFGNEYYGIEFPKKTIDDLVWKNKCTGTFLTEYFMMENKI
jgi:hypothetical protein